MLHGHAQGQDDRRVEQVLLVWHGAFRHRRHRGRQGPGRLPLGRGFRGHGPGRPAQLDSERPWQDDIGADDLIGLACTSVHTGVRWLDMIRQGAAWVVGSVQLQMVFELQTTNPPAPLVQPTGWLSVNGTAGSRLVSCPAGKTVTDCTCKASEPNTYECAYLQFSNAQGCSSSGAIHKGDGTGTVLGTPLPPPSALRPRPPPRPPPPPPPCASRG